MDSIPEKNDSCEQGFPLFLWNSGPQTTTEIKISLKATAATTTTKLLC